MEKNKKSKTPKEKFLDRKFPIMKKFTDLDQMEKLEILEKQLQSVNKKITDCSSSKFEDKKKLLGEILGEVTDKVSLEASRILEGELMEKADEVVREFLEEEKVPQEESKKNQMKSIGNKITQVEKRINTILKNKCQDGSLKKLVCDEIKKDLSNWKGVRTQEKLDAFLKIEKLLHTEFPDMA
jgi:hypothetical protein